MPVPGKNQANVDLLNMCSCFWTEDELVLFIILRRKKMKVVVNLIDSKYSYTLRHYLLRPVRYRITIMSSRDISSNESKLPT